jgi:hypothetical protein
MVRLEADKESVMNPKRAWFVGAVLATLMAAPALAQKVNQPWTAPRGAHESRVVTCTSPNPAAAWRISLDDWICPKTGPMSRVQWWGIVTSQAQATRPYYIAIWSHATTGACGPGAKVYQACVIPSSKYVGTDCNGRRVYRFSASLPQPWFSQQQGQHYWLQVSEIDSNSVQVGAEDFRWSSHLPIKPAPYCQAVQITGGGVVIQPTPDDCPQPIATDLAFRMFGTTLSGTLTTIHLRSPSVFLLELRSPAGDLLEQHCVDPNDDGSFEVEIDSPPGRYDVELIGMGLTGLRTSVEVMPGDNMLTLPQPCLDADFDRDGDAGTDQDIEAFFRVIGGACG